MPTRKYLAFGLLAFGAFLILAGIALIFVPAALIVAGCAAIGVGLFGVELG
jgi:hypothetical protein